jgi:tetratricopeptide (TPR) repeat protein
LKLIFYIKKRQLYSQNRDCTLQYYGKQIEKLVVMKKGKILFVIMVIANLSVHGQLPHENPKYGPDSASRMECAKNLSTMSEFVKINLFDRAYDSWLYCFNNCPSGSKNIYLYGSKILKHKIENTSDEAEKQKFVEKLMALYDQRMEHYKQEGYVLGIKGIDLLRYDKERVQDSYELLKQSVDKSKAKSLDAVLVTFIQTSYILYVNEVITAEEFADNYFMDVEFLEQKLAKKKSAQTEKAMETVEKIFMDSKAPNCEMLIGYFSPKFEENTEDVEILTKITTYLREFECTESVLFANAAEKLFAKEPSAESAYNLAKLFYSKEDYEKSKHYYEKAIEFADDGETKAKYYYELGGIMNTHFKDYIQAKKYANKALELNPDWGDPYILIGNAYASGNKVCGNKFEQSAVFWAVVDKYMKAKNVDSSVQERANELIKRYSQYFPNNEETFFQGLKDGDPYTIGCWINETTTVRTTKI